MEIQDVEPEIKLPLECIGFKGVRRKIIIESEEYPIALDSELDVCISIDESRRGAHLSRNYTAIMDVLEETRTGKSIEDYLYKIAERLLSKHEYAKRSYVNLRTSYYAKIPFYEIVGIEPVQVNATIILDRESMNPKWSLTVGLYGMSVCPSAQSKIAEMLKYDENQIAPSHSQKVLGRITVESSERRIIRIESLAEILAGSFSAPAFSFLKRDKEAILIIRAHERPRFAEDIVREAAKNLYHLLKDRGFGEETVIRVEVESYESIHPQNVYASLRASLGELDQLLGSRIGISTRSIDS